ncbi:hypothetical protein [Methanobrevibacter arboriphilus]|uniref:hypothetical protein n=1 Tax=Methanobrevibacter arboriphilus TaxID=39441 RepID=UPI00241C5A62|nr:hypothetical protein [Methanobrevibacter arboriphilus]
MVFICRSISPLTSGGSEVTIVYELRRPASKNPIKSNKMRIILSAFGILSPNILINIIFN